jgi:hypothetical protein
MNTARRAFRVYRCPCNCDCGFWRWECTLCRPPARGRRQGPGAWDAICRISLPHHFRVRRYHHAWVRRTRGAGR